MERKKYAAEFKREAVRLAGQAGVSRAQVAQELGLNVTMLARWVRHEQGASLMAAGYARASGKVAACFVVPGPGLSNALTGIGMVHSESAPMLVEAFGANSLRVAGPNNGRPARSVTPP